LKFLFDENLPVPAARALKEVGEPVTHVQFEGLRGTRDVDMAQHLRANGWILVTADSKIRKRVQERVALISAGVGAFVFSGKAKRTGRDWLELIFRRWEDIKRYAQANSPPYLVQVPDRGSIHRLK
jgi:PIN domain-containing protein